MFSNMNLSDRLKAAVKEIETHGTALQQRAIQAAGASGSGSAGASGGTSTATSPTISTKPTIPAPSAPIPTGTPPLASTTGTGESVISPSSGTSAKSLLSTGSSAAGAAVSTANHLAEGALSGLSGLRKSFNFVPRTSQDGSRPGTSPGGSPSLSVGTSAAGGPQELKNLPLSPPGGAGPSRSTSPAPAIGSRLATPAPFALGSEASTTLPTPRPVSPAVGASHLRTASSSALPPSNPDDPATYPLPLSPPAGSMPLSASGFLDPLGASPLLTPSGDALPSFGLIPEATTGEEHANAGLGIHTGPAERGAPRPQENGDAGSVMENGQLPQDVGLEAIGKLADADGKYNDLLARHSTLLREADSANKILKELTPLEGGITDAEALEGWVRMMNGKVVISGEELARLQGKIALQDSRMEELRDTHRLEGSSQTELISKLRSQLSSAETNLASKATELLTLAQLRTDLSKAQTTAKEEEEKRTKAISLLKTVRMKLVKAEKEKEEVERDRAEERAERSRSADEVERVKAERESTINALRKGFEREMQAARDRFEKELAARKGAWELEMITTKAAHAKELTNKNTKIAGLEMIVKELSGSKNELFETLQSRQEEVEGARGEMETLRNRTNELEFQLREATERNAILEEASGAASGPDRSRSALGLGVPSPRGNSPSPSRNSSFTNASELQRLLAEAENRSESKLADLRHKIRSVEKERNEAEEEWAAKLQERVHETDKLRRMLAEKEGEYADSLRARDLRDAQVREAEEGRKGVEKEVKALRARLEEAKEDVAVAADGERLAKDELSALKLQVSNQTLSLEDSKNQYATLQTKHKTLRDELRKLQSSVQLMEKSRNPGVGYWAQGGQHQASSSSSASASAGGSTPVLNGNASATGAGAPPDTPTPSRRSTADGRQSVDSTRTAGRGSTVGGADEEEVNLEFLEHKEMRPNLVRVLSVILHFTPQELRRLNAKLQA